MLSACGHRSAAAAIAIGFRACVLSSPSDLKYGFSYMGGGGGGCQNSDLFLHTAVSKGCILMGPQTGQSC